MATSTAPGYLAQRKWKAGASLDPRLARFLRRFARSRLALPGAVTVLLIALIAVMAPAIAPYDPIKQVYADALSAPSGAHPFGVDNLGRDILSRVMYGARMSVGVGVASIGFALIVGVPLGMLAGFMGGWIDRAIVALMDALMSFPALILALGLAAALGPGVTNVTVAVGVVYVPTFARLSRGQTLSLRERDFVAAARVLGASTKQIIFRHVLCNLIDPLIVQASLCIALAILAEASLSFLGVGVPPPTPSWGGMLREGFGFVETAWWIANFPGLAILVAVLGISFAGDGLRDALGK